MRKAIFLLFSLMLFSAPVRADDRFLYAMDLSRAGHLREAREIMHALADAGDCDAQSQYAVMLMFGNGGEMNSEEGVRQLTKAANQGEPLAQMTMGDLYYNKVNITNVSCAPGNCPSGTPQRNLVVAYKWYLLAETRTFTAKDRGYEAKILALIRSELSDADRSAGEKLAAEWKPTPHLCDLRHYYQ